MFKLQGRTLFAAVTTLTALSFMQIGWDNGLMGGLVGAPAFNTTFNKPGPTMLGLIVSIMEIGAFLGSVASSIFGEQLGRKKTLAIAVVIMMIGALLQATAYTRVHMIIARIVAGVGLGISNSTAPVLQAEYSPKANRGLYVCMQLSTLNFGIFLVYWMGYGFSSHTGSYAWRIPCILQWVLLIPMLILCFVVDETPRWLVAHDRHDEAMDVLQRLKGKELASEQITALHEEIVKTNAMEKAIGAGSWKDLLRNDSIQSQRRFFIACGIQAMQQLGGINALVYYSSTLFQQSVGLSPNTAGLLAGGLQTWFFVASFIPWFLIDRIGRRPLLLSMITVMACVMVAQTGLIYAVQNKPSMLKSAGAAGAAMLFIFEGAFTIGFQATVWVYPSEILPLRLRQRGSSISTASNWIINYAVVQFTPPAIANIKWRTYIIFAVLNFAFLPIIYFFFPETKGLELEEIDRLFEKNDGVAQAVREVKAEQEHIEAKSADDYKV